MKFNFALLDRRNSKSARPHFGSAATKAFSSLAQLPVRIRPCISPRRARIKTGADTPLDGRRDKVAPQIFSIPFEFVFAARVPAGLKVSGYVLAKPEIKTFRDLRLRILTRKWRIVRASVPGVLLPEATALARSLPLRWPLAAHPPQHRPPRLQCKTGRLHCPMPPPRNLFQLLFQLTDRFAVLCLALSASIRFSGM